MHNNASSSYLKKILLSILVIGTLLVVTTKLFANNNTENTNPQPSKRIHAVISSETRATISSPMSGYIRQLNIKEGETFKKDQLLVKFDCKVFLAELRKAKAQVKLTKVNNASYQRLSRLGSASKVKVEESKTAYEKALAEEKIAEKQISDCQIKAPFDGQVTELFVHQHETVELYQKLFVILANKPLIVRVLIPSSWLDWVRIGTQFKIHINETDKDYNVTVARIVHQVDAVSQSVKVIGEPKGNYSDLKSGMSGYAEFPRKTQ